MKSNIHQRAATSLNDFRLTIQAELARRCAENPQYSLRAFAKFLGIDHSTLSQMLRRKRPFTEKAIRKFGVRLGLPEADIERWILQEQDQLTQQAAIQQATQLTQDVAMLMSDIKLYSILELTRLQTFQPDSRWIARVLGISVDEVNVALQCLIRLGMLEMASADKWIDHLGDAMTTMQDFTQAGIEQYLRQLHRLTMESMQQQPAEKYTISATTLAVNRERIPAAIEMIERFRHELAAYLRQASEHDDLYHLQLSFVPVTCIHKE